MQPLRACKKTFNGLHFLTFFLQLNGILPFTFNGRNIEIEFSPEWLCWAIYVRACHLASALTKVLLESRVKLGTTTSSTVGKKSFAFFNAFFSVVITLPHTFIFFRSKKLAQVLRRSSKLLDELDKSLRGSKGIPEFDFQCLIMTGFSAYIFLMRAKDDRKLTPSGGVVKNAFVSFNSFYIIASAMQCVWCYRAIFRALGRIVRKASEKHVHHLKNRCHDDEAALRHIGYLQDHLRRVGELSQQTLHLFVTFVPMLLVVMSLAVILAAYNIGLDFVGEPIDVATVFGCHFCSYIICDATQGFINECEKLQESLREINIQSSNVVTMAKIFAICEEIEEMKDTRIGHLFTIRLWTFLSICELVTTYVIIMFQIGDWKQ